MVWLSLNLMEKNLNCPYKYISVLIFGLLVFHPVLSFSQQEGGGEEEPTWEQPTETSRTISLDVKGMDIIDVLKILSDEGGFNLSIGGNVSGKVNLFLKDIDVWDALEIVFISGNLAYEQKGEIIYVMREVDYELKYGRKYWDKREVQVFNLKYARVSRIRELFTKVVSKIGKVIVDEPTNTLVIIDAPGRIAQVRDIIEMIDRPIETKIFELNYIPADKIKENIQETLTLDVGTLKIDEGTNKLIVTDYPEKMRQIEQMILAFDEKPLQVLIDAQIIEIKPSRKFNAGINWDYWIRKHFRTTQTFSIPTTSTDKLSIGTADSTVTQKGNFSGALEFLQTFGETKILSSPRIMVLNNHEAKILVGTKDVYITSTISQSTGTSISAQTVEFVDVGVKLYVTPTINKLGYITLKIKPEISSSTRETIKTEDKETQVPIVTTSEAETTIIVKDGVSIIIGGLRKISREKERKQIPVLGNIPVLGVFFRSKKDEWSKNELIILLTPRIVSGDKSIEMELREKIEKGMGEHDVLEELKKEGVEDFEFLEDGISLPPLQSQRQDDVTDTDEYAMGRHEIGEMSEPVEAIEKAGQEATLKKSERYSYDLQIVEKIQRAASLYSTQNRSLIDENAEEKENVRLRFTISRKGLLLEEPQIVFSANEDLNDAAKEIIIQSSPFLPFPDFKKKEKEVFEVLLIF